MLQCVVECFCLTAFLKLWGEQSDRQLAKLLIGLFLHVVRDDSDMIKLLRIGTFQTLADGMDDYFIFLIGREEN